MANANYYFAQNGDLLDRKTKEKVGSWKAGADGKRKISLSNAPAKPAPSGGNSSYAYREDGSLIDRQSGKKVGTWKTSSKTGKRVATMTDGSPAAQAPTMPGVNQAHSPGVEAPFTQLAPNVMQQSGVKGVPNLQTPQLSMTDIGKKGMTPGEILNYLTEHENQLRGAQDQRTQQGLDMLSATQGGAKGMMQNGLVDSLKYLRGGAQGAKDYLNQGMEAQNAALRGGIKTERQYFQEGMGKATGAMASGQKGMLSDYDKALGQGTGYLKDARNTTRGIYDESRGYLSSLGNQQTSRINEDYAKSVDADNQRMAGRGLSNSTINMTSKGVYGRNKNDALLGVDEMRAKANLGLNQDRVNSETGYGNSLAGLSSGVLQNRANAQGSYGRDLAGLYDNMYARQGQAELGYGSGLAGVAGQGYGALAQNQSNYGNAAAGNVSNVYGNMAQSEIGYGQNVANMLRPNWNDPTAGVAGSFAAPKTDSNWWDAIGGGLLNAGTQGIGSLIGGAFGGIGGALKRLFSSSGGSQWGQQQSGNFFGPNGTSGNLVRG